MNIRFHHRLFSIARRVALFHVLAFLFSVARLAPPVFAAEAKEPAALERTQPADPGSQHASVVRRGVVGTKDGLTLRLTTDLGSVNIVQLEAGAAPIVRYTVRIETDARGTAAQQLLDTYSLKAKSIPTGVEITGVLPPQAARSADAQFWVQFEVAVPRGYSIEVTTEAGDITTADIGGTASLHTQGGNIKTGRIGSSGLRDAAWGRSAAKLETEGGHIQVLDVAGDLTAHTGGGHINVGNIAGDASLRTGGGHIRAGQIGGRAELETVGGNITVAHAGNFVSVRTGGGQIDFGEVRGSVHAQTGGGGIRVMYVSGPMELESSSGSICLTRVAGALQAATGGGTITAWINPDATSESGNVRLAGASQLSSGNGDIVVFLPRNLAANIDATVANGGERRIEADPALHLTMQASTNGSGPVHAMAVLNGGGAPLRLRTTGGKIRLQFLDSEIALHESLIREQVDRLNKRLKENGFDPVSFTPAVGPGIPTLPEMPTPSEAKTDWLESWLTSLEITFRGGLTENPDDFQKRLVNSPKPSFPALAQRAGLQGLVKLQVRVKKDGSVEVQKLLEGEPALADAAIAAVKQWRAKPAAINGKQVEVISTVTFNFQLH
ncbi:MAG TPA: energy transducer TonB [Candidatus Acidoferrum sp.]|nr:energy transducer TonB [Candidatus Acidoferrum sp.]